MLHKHAVEPATLEILKKICLLPACEKFALGGGTSLALRSGHRFSVDLDFFTSQPFTNAVVYKAINAGFQNTELLFEQNQTMMFLINGVKTDFILYPFEWLYPFDEKENVRLISAEDIIPMKLQAVSNRFAKKDFWDIEFLLTEFSLEKMLTLFKNKFPQVDTGYIIQSLTNFENADKEENPVDLIHKTWEEIKDSLRSAVRKFVEDKIKNQ